MAYQTLLYDVADQIATVTLNRPHKMNSFTMQVGDEICDALLEADRDRKVRAIIMTGAGDRAFCAGADLEGFAQRLTNKPVDKPSKPSSDKETEGSNQMHRMTTAMRSLSKPTIAAINGYALGVGLTLTLPLDVRVCSENAKLGFIFGRAGLMAEMGSTYLLPRLIGFARATEMMLTGRHFTAAEALEWGLVTHVAPHGQVMAKAREVAAEMIQCAPLSLELTRHALYEGLRSTLEEAVHLEAVGLDRCFASPQHKEYVNAFKEKRKPDFSKVG